LITFLIWRLSEMLGWEEWMEVKDLKRQGHSIKEICRRTSYSRNTVRKVLREAGPVRRARKKRFSKLDEYKAYLKDRYERTGLSAVRLTEEIRAMGFTGSVDIVRRYLNELDAHRFPEKATVRFETPPGEQSQVDWAYIGRFMDDKGRLRKVYAFVMVLSFSRMLYVEFTLSMRIEELIRCHQNAFEYFGGWTHTILYDNMSQVRLPSGKLNPLMADFLSHHGIALKTCQPYRARTKGKVERVIRYLRGNFLKGREFANLADLLLQGTHWQEEVANKRIHATTKQRPIDLFREEKLVPISSAPTYIVSQRLERRVSADGFVHVSGSRYSVPPMTVGKKVIVEQGEQRIVVRHGEVIVAEHDRARRSGECVADPKHVAEMWKLSLRRQEVPPRPAERLLFQAVEARPLAVYEEVFS
jgi:transposase